MTQALLAAIFAMTFDDPLEASRFLVIGWQAAFEAYVLPAAFSLVLQGLSREATARESATGGPPEVPSETEGAPRGLVRANADRERGERPFPTNLSAGTLMAEESWRAAQSAAVETSAVAA
jgi:hypothetical protein